MGITRIMQSIIASAIFTDFFGFKLFPPLTYFVNQKNEAVLVPKTMIGLVMSMKIVEITDSVS